MKCVLHECVIFKNTYIEMISVVKFIDFSGKVNSYNLGKMPIIIIIVISVENLIIVI